MTATRPSSPPRLGRRGSSRGRRASASGEALFLFGDLGRERAAETRGFRSRESGASNALGLSGSVKPEAGPARTSVRLGAPRLARIARRWVAGSGRNLSAGPVQNTVTRLARESG